MSDAITTGLQGALRGAIEGNGSAGLNGAGASNDLMNLAIKLLPKLLDGVEDRESLAELQKESHATLRKHVLLLRRQHGDLLQSHMELLEEFRLMRKLQSSLVAHLARVQILDLPDDGDLGDEMSDDADDQLVHRREARRRLRPR